MERAACPFTESFYIPLKFLTKNSLRNLSLLSKALGKEFPSMFPKRGLLWKQTPNSRAFLFLGYLSGSPVKEPSLQVPLIELPQREMPHF
jgi:hypothetical protein